MGSLVLAITCVVAFPAGCLLGYAVLGYLRDQKRYNRIRLLTVGQESGYDLVSHLEVRGLSAIVLEYAYRQTQQLSPRLPSFLGRPNKTLQHKIQRAGLAESITTPGLRQASLRLMCWSLIAGVVIGSMFSPLLGFVLGCAGAVLGWALPSRALAEEIRLRTFVAEKHLSQMIEILILGLQSGMSFDRALLLYCQSFSGSLAGALSVAHSQWTHSLTSRSDALRSVAASYDSILFDRFAENVIRSLRFGTSLADNLSSLAGEARSIRKAKLQEMVAKAPVKMLLPVGTLILPAMLILILGPILLDLMQG